MSMMRKILRSEAHKSTNIRANKGSMKTKNKTHYKWAYLGLKQKPKEEFDEKYYMQGM